MAITVGSVEVDVVPNTQGIYARLRAGLVPPATAAGRDAGRAAGEAFSRQFAASAAGAVRDGLQAGGRAAAGTATRQGSDSGGAFGRAFQDRVRAAMASLPRADVRLSDTGFNADLARLRSRLETLSGKRIGVDVDAARALAEVDRLDADLDRLGSRHPDIQVRMDTGRARAELATLRAQIAATDANDVDIDVDVDTGRAMAAIFQLTVALAGVAATPAIPFLAAGLVSVAAAGVAAAAGVGALGAAAAPAILDITAALQAQKAATDAAATSTANSGQAAAQAASRSLQLAGAQQALASAERNGARQVAQAQTQVRQARQAAADAAEQAARRQEQAARAVREAEGALADAQRDARQAQADLTDARREAAAELEDLANRSAAAQLAQRDAALGVREAQAELNRTLADPQATGIDRERAQLAYDQAVQRLREQTVETRRLAEEQAEADRTGVAGTDTVRQAQERLAQAQEEVADRAQGVRDAQEEAARVQVETSRQVAAAQERVSEATANVAAAQQAAADGVASAQRQIAAAQTSAAGTADAAATAQAKYEAALAAMTPATRETYDSFLSLRDAFQEWSRSLQPDVMPIFTRALDGMRNSLPGLTPFVREAADAIGDLQDRVSRGLQSEGWQRFRDDLADATGPAITGLGISIGNIGRGLGGIIGAFLPHMDSISERMQSITDPFGDWGQGLRGSPAFENFLDYAAENGPLIAETLGEIGRAFADVVRELEPLSGPALQILGGLAEAVSWLATTVPGLVQGIYLLIIATRLWAVATVAATLATRAFTLGMALFNAVMGANPIVLVTLAIAALVAGVIYAYNNFEWFRNGVQAAWDGIQAAAVWAWETVLKPTFEAIAEIVVWLWDTIIWPYFNLIINYYRMLGDIAMWLWEHAISPAIDGIAAVISWWWENIVKRYFNLVKDIITTVGDTISWLWNEVVDPVIGWIGDRIEWIWENAVRPAFDGMKTGVQAVGEAFEAAKDAIQTAWEALEDITKAPVNFVINTVYNDGIRSVWNTVVGAFGGTKLERVPALATGGVLPGYTPGRDVHLAALSGGEAVMRPEWTRAVGAGYVDAMNAAARTGGVAGVQKALGLPAFADGGIFEGIGDVASGAWDLVKEGADWLQDTFSSAVLAGAEAVVNPLIDLIPGDTGFVRLLKDGARSMARRLVGAGERGEEEAAPHVDYRPSAGVEQWRPVVLQSLREVRQPASLADTTLRRMQQESGGNPTIVNRWDINWQRGTPSVGLMQVIGPTFRAHAGKYRDRGPFSYGVSVDPLANIYSSMRYALSRYGSLSSAYNRPGGYDRGGWLRPGQLGFNGLSQPEAVLTPGQWRAMSTLADRGASMGDVHVRVHVGDREITDIVRTEVSASNGQLATALRARRRG